MNDTQLLSEISSLPDSIKKEVLDFVEFLKQKSQKKSHAKERGFGNAKGYFKLSDNIDEPLEDFKDYI